MTKRVVLTGMERAFMLNQFRILHLLEPKGGHEVAIEVLEQGYEYFYDRLFPDFDTVPHDECVFVMSVLDMFWLLQLYMNDHPEDKDISKRPEARFLGFDGNHEGRLMSFTRHLIRKQKWYPEQLKNKALASSEFNSHMPMRERYARMLRALAAIKQAAPPHPLGFRLTREQVLIVLAGKDEENDFANLLEQL